jgi:hypothetical protein
MNTVDQLVHTTVRIETLGAKGQGSGTGFFLNVADDGERRVPLIVTNKHVISGASEGRFHFTLQNSVGQPDLGSTFIFALTDFEAGWVPHPDPSVDLAAFPIAGLLDHMVELGKPVFHRGFPVDLICDETFLNTLTAIEDVIMIGYPSGLWDPKHNFPIVRRGVTATPPGVPFDGREEFVIDCACFPGSSGSPVVLYNPTGHIDKQANSFAMGGRVRLLGVLWGGPQFNAVGELHVVPVPTSTAPTKEIALSRIPMNLGYCVRASQLLWFENHFRAALAVQDGAGSA